MADSSPVEPHLIFSKLFRLLDDLRHTCFRLSSVSQQKRMQGLTVRQCSAIARVELLTQDCPQGISLKMLAQHLQMTVPATSLLVETLVSRGLLERTPNPHDRRAVCIRISEKGRSFFEEVNGLVNAEMDKLASVLTEEELSAVSCAADKLLHQYSCSQDKTR